MDFGNFVISNEHFFLGKRNPLTADNFHDLLTGHFGDVYKWNVGSPSVHLYEARDKSLITGAASVILPCSLRQLDRGLGVDIPVDVINRLNGVAKPAMEVALIPSKFAEASEIAHKKLESGTLRSGVDATILANLVANCLPSYITVFRKPHNNGHHPVYARIVDAYVDKSSPINYTGKDVLMETAATWTTAADAAVDLCSTFIQADLNNYQSSRFRDRRSTYLQLAQDVSNLRQNLALTCLDQRGLSVKPGYDQIYRRSIWYHNIDLPRYDLDTNCRPS